LQARVGADAHISPLRYFFKLQSDVAAPPASPLDAIQPDEGGFVRLLSLDMDAYIEKYGREAPTLVKAM
jgi:hypothetical protein